MAKPGLHRGMVRPAAGLGCSPVAHLGSGKAGKDFHADAFGLLRLPARNAAQADSLKAIIPTRRCAQVHTRATGRSSLGGNQSPVRPRHHAIR